MFYRVWLNKFHLLEFNSPLLFASRDLLLLLPLSLRHSSLSLVFLVFCSSQHFKLVYSPCHVILVYAVDVTQPFFPVGTFHVTFYFVWFCAQYVTRISSSSVKVTVCVISSYHLSFLGITVCTQRITERKLSLKICVSITYYTLFLTLLTQNRTVTVNIVSHSGVHNPMFSDK